jgi:hypothetical protein
MLLAYRKSTGEVIPDFQSNATAAGLRANAERAGIESGDMDIRDLGLEQYQAAEDAYYAPFRESEAAATEQAIQAGKSVAERLGLSRDDLLALGLYASAG